MTLLRSQSDHYPILLTLYKGQKSRPSSFKFFNMWCDNVDCSRLVKESWSRHVIGGNNMSILFQKLKRLKYELKDWNKNVFSDVKVGVVNAAKILDVV